MYVSNKGKAQAESKPDCVFLLQNSSPVYACFSLGFLIISHFGIILFFLNFGSALIGLVIRFLQKFIFPCGSVRNPLFCSRQYPLSRKIFVSCGFSGGDPGCLFGISMLFVSVEKGFCLCSPGSLLSLISP